MLHGITETGTRQQRGRNLHELVVWRGWREGEGEGGRNEGGRGEREGMRERGRNKGGKEGVNEEGREGGEG